MMKSGLVSIIIPTYNSSKYIENCIKSIISQTYKTWEVILVNEFDSSDNILKIVEPYLNYYPIRVIQNKKRLGRVESRNVGIREAQGEFVAFLDSDDSFLPEKLERQIKFLNENEEFGGCGCQMQMYNGTDFLQTTSWHPVNEEDCKVALLFMSPCWVSSMVFRKKYFDKFMLYSTFNTCEDYDMLVNSYGKFRFTNIDGALVKYLIHESNASLNIRVIEEEKIERVKISQKMIANFYKGAKREDIFGFVLCNFNKYAQPRSKFKLAKSYLFFENLYNNAIKSHQFSQNSLDKIFEDKFSENFDYHDLPEHTGSGLCGSKVQSSFRPMGNGGSGFRTQI